MAHQLNATINTIEVKKAQAAQGAIRVLAQQRRQFMLYAEASTAPVAPITMADDAEALRKVATDNYAMIQNYEAQDSSTRATCWVEASLAEDGPRKSQLDIFKSTGTLQLFLAPPKRDTTVDQIISYRNVVNKIEVRQISKR